MNILFLIDELVSRGGTEAHLYDLVQRLSEKKFKVAVVSLLDGPFSSVFRKLKGVDYHCLQVSRIYDSDGIRGVAWLARYLKNNNIDILQTFHTGADLIGPVAGLIAGNKKLKIISSRRDMGYTKNRKHIFFQKFINRWVNYILANSKEVKDAVIVRESVPPAKVNVIYNGIHIEPLLKVTPNQIDDFKKKYEVPTNRTVIGSIGNLRPVKGFEDLIRSAPQVIDSCPDALFLVAGEGDQKDLLQLIDKLDLSAHFRFLGAISEIPAFLGGLRCYVQPSRSEGFSNAVLEAMGAGLPVVVTDVGGNKEVVHNGIDGIKVGVGEPHFLANAILSLIQDESYSAFLSKNARSKIISNFQVETMIKNYIEHYEASLRDC